MRKSLPCMIVCLALAGTAAEVAAQTAPTAGQAFEAQAEQVVMSATHTAADVAKAAAANKLLKDGLDTVFALVLLAFISGKGRTRVGRAIQEFFFGFADDLRARAEALKRGEITDPIERGMITEAMSRVNAGKILFMAIVLGASFIY